MAGSWHPVADGESRREFQFPLKHGDLPESEIPDAALFLVDRGIRTRYGKAAIASPPDTDDRSCPERHHSSRCRCVWSAAFASAVPKMRGNGRSEDVIFFDGVFFEPSLKSIFFAS